jgi:DNA-binding response OmpR family regulator
MRRLLVLEHDDSARQTIIDVAKTIGYHVLLYEREVDARRAWAAASAPDVEGGNTFQGAVIDGRPESNGFDLARYIREGWPFALLVLTVDNTSVCYQACDELMAACVARSNLARGLARELGPVVDR